MKWNSIQNFPGIIPSNKACEIYDIRHCKIFVKVMERYDSEDWTGKQCQNKWETRYSDCSVDKSNNALFIHDYYYSSIYVEIVEGNQAIALYGAGDMIFKLPIAAGLKEAYWHVIDIESSITLKVTLIYFDD